ncbi:MAG: DPP IV N-terminal domain-containing protein [Planctomycetia bacterium]|nr:DPP IV N-terminal domain-containing protein [Planctomycetia bacterium]
MHLSLRLTVRSNAPILLLFCSFLVFFVFSSDFSAYGQESSVDDVLTMQRIYGSGYFSEQGFSATWSSSGAAFVRQVESSSVSGGRDVVLEKPDGSREIVVSASELIPRDSNKENPRPIAVSDYELSSDAQTVLIYTNTRRVWRRNTRGDYWALDRRHGVFRQLGVGVTSEPCYLQFAKLSPDGSRVGYVYKNNLYVEEVVSGAITQLTFDGSDDIINGTFDWVYEEEFDCRDGWRWSPDGKYIAFWRLDSSAEPMFVMLDNVGLSTSTGAARIEATQLNGDFQINETPSDDNASPDVLETDAQRLRSYPTLVAFKYPRVGCANATAQIGVITLPTPETQGYDPVANTRFVNFNDPEEFYLPQMQWHTGQGGLIVHKTPRSQRLCEAYRIDPETAEPTFLFSDADPDGAWQTVYPLYELQDGDRFIRISERDGWRRYYLSRFSDLTEQRALTPPECDAIEFVSFDYDASGQENGVYYYASPSNATQRFLYRASLEGENQRVVFSNASESRDNGTESWSLSADSNWAIYRRSSFGVPSRVELVQLDGAQATVSKVLVDNQALRKKLDEARLGDFEFFSVEIDEACDFEKKAGATNTEKISVDGWVLTPNDWDEDNSSKTYPLLVYVYGEPAAQTVLDSWGGSTYLYHRAICERGCVVVCFENRGTPAPKGRAWRKRIYEKFGAVGRSDQAASLRAFLSTWHGASKIDVDRIGVWGWSGGGTSTLNLMFNYPDLYKCGIAIAPVPDYRNYDTIYQERYSGLITETPESYELGSAIGYAGNLQGKLLVIHGSGDDNCHFQTTERLINALIAAGKDFEAFMYPYRSHGIFEGAGTTLHLRNKTMEFWERNLLAPVNAQ